MAFNQFLPPLIGLEEEIIALHNVSILGTQVLASFKELTPAAIYNLIVLPTIHFLKRNFLGHSKPAQGLLGVDWEWERGKKECELVEELLY